MNILKKIVKESNIYQAIFSLKSYVTEPNLLDKTSYEQYLKLKDCFNEEYIKEIIKKVKAKIESVINNDDVFFETNVYFKPKKLEGNNEIISRPIHSADLITQISLVAITNFLIYENVDNNLELSILSKSIPCNFYGNIPSKLVNNLYQPWQKKYREYLNLSSNAYNFFCETKEYTYEVSLDLVNFFPSIDPNTLYNIIIKYIKPYHSPSEIEEYKKVLEKLLFMKIKNIEYCRNLYYSISSDLNNTDFILGVPQGLPHSYFLSNIYMKKISEIYNKNFTYGNIPSKSFYYVDDSVIFTKLKITENNFKETLNKINDELNKLKEYNIIPFINNEIISFYDESNYNLKVHVENEKSTYLEINEKKLGESHLNSIGRIASLATQNFFSLFQDLDKKNLLENFKSMKKAIELEIGRIDVLTSEETSINKSEIYHYKKQLIRYKKFFNYRKDLLALEFDLIKQENINEFIDRLKYIKEGAVEKFFDYYNEGSFYSDFLIYSKSFHSFHSELKEEISLLSKKIYGTDYEKICLVYNTYNNQQSYKLLSFDKYKTLNNFFRIKLGDILLKSEELKHKFLNEKLNISSLKSNFFENDLFKDLYRPHQNYILHNSSELQRRTLNAIFSIIFNYQLNDNISISKNNTSMINYYEIKTMLFLRNRLFDYNEFYNFYNNSNNLYSINSEEIDYTLLRAIPYFTRYVKKASEIDNLIMIHKYTQGIWKNGSKFLHFYTLHNHEHAVDLIQNSINIIKNIHFLNIKRIDYYILFISCYLHDISMVLHPNLSKLVTSSDLQLKKIMTTIQNSNNDENINISLLEAYYKLDSYFEGHIRNSHATKSADFIRTSKDLNFLTAPIKDIVAKCSESHGFAPYDIYSVKSKAKSELVSEKYIKILLRLSDLLDISKQRISEPIINNNLEYMSDVSKFHWISHKIINHYEIKSTYKIEEKLKEKSYIGRGQIVEEVTFNIYLNTNIIYGIDEKSIQCQNTVSLNKINTEGAPKYILELETKDSCSSENCNFLCKWMAEKNDYFYQELNVLEKYLKNTSNYFDTKFKINLICDNNDFLTQKEHDFLREFLIK